MRCGDRIAAGGGVEGEQIRVRLVPLAELPGRRSTAGTRWTGTSRPRSTSLGCVRRAEPALFGDYPGVADGVPILYQAEWCPFSSAVREALTELGIDYTIRQVAPVRRDRDELKGVAGTDQIPVFQAEDGELYRGTREIFRHLREREPWKYAAAHRRRFADTRRCARDRRAGAPDRVLPRQGELEAAQEEQQAEPEVTDVPDRTASSSGSAGS